MKTIKILLVIAAFITFGISALKAEDGSRLWLRYNSGANATVTSKVKNSKTTEIAIEELKSQWRGTPVELLIKQDKTLCVDGFKVQGSKFKVQIIANTDKGLLYGAYHLLRLQATGQISDNLDITENPKYKIRILNHWDNLNGSIERGYAGKSLWNRDELPAIISPRYEEYARAN
ncbi:MAG: alpha-glucuronidase, partial [Paludibacter sp.]|nr:alpha-glucuronidase [Paludibacter sp.]